MGDGSGREMDGTTWEGTCSFLDGYEGGVGFDRVYQLDTNEEEVSRGFLSPTRGEAVVLVRDGTEK